MANFGLEIFWLAGWLDDWQDGVAMTRFHLPRSTLHAPRSTSAGSNKVETKEKKGKERKRESAKAKLFRVTRQSILVALPGSLWLSLALRGFLRRCLCCASTASGRRIPSQPTLHPP